mgnify:CR=1 FL=1
MMDHLPKKITVIGIEKGAGRTTFASAFFSFNIPAVYSDCDMQSNDFFKYLPAGHIGESKFQGTPHAEIDPSKCSLCLECWQNCRYKAIFINPDGIPEVDRYSCEGCFICSRSCPFEAISETAYSGGKWLTSYAGSSVLVGATLASNEKSNADYIFQLNTRAAKIAIKENMPFVIVDGPSGETLPLVAAITGASRVIIIAEPSWNTFQKLNTIISLVKGLKVHAALIINKADLNKMVSHQIRALANKNNLELIGEIPYDIAFQDMAASQNIWQKSGPVIDVMKKIWEEILQEFNEEATKKHILY